MRYITKSASTSSGVATSGCCRYTVEHSGREWSGSFGGNCVSWPCQCASGEQSGCIIRADWTRIEGNGIEIRINTSKRHARSIQHVSVITSTGKTTCTSQNHLVFPATARNAQENHPWNMKQRITYILPDGSNVHRADLKVSNNSLYFTKADEAAEEWRLTLGLDDLPEEVGRLLSQLFPEL